MNYPASMIISPVLKIPTTYFFPDKLPPRVITEDSIKDGQSWNMGARRLQQAYLDGFTIHGLSRVFTGRPLERVFWLLSLLAAASFIGFMCTGNYKNYLANDIRTEVRVKAANEITLPIMHICDDFLAS